MSPDEVLAARLEQTAATDESGNTAYDLSPVGPTPSAAVEPTAYFDPSMQTEGLSWCIDLTAPDSTFILPVVLWLSISANIIFRRTAGGSKTAASPKAEDATPRKAEFKVDDFTTGPMDPKALKVLTAPTYGENTRVEPFLGFLPPINNAQRIGLCIAMALGGAMLQMPAAVLLYFIPSLAVGWVQRRWLDANATDLDPLYESMYQATRALQEAELAPRRNQDVIKERHKVFEEAVFALDWEVFKHERCGRKRREYFSEGAQFE
ncbi:hypothetical protein B0A55_04858 [Friedmanniomyces simplex]|uniref:Uncharacterized protein n=1 Tax=Friedmanniomyces simplex TaxID=329884 RepID=A0A4U0XK22_9PEZI|nr:hypothetical protein B0A55_04858 [Friedmanniomyces simplex]